MSDTKEPSTEEMLLLVKKFFEDDGYVCSTYKRIKKKGLLFEVDLLCNKKEAIIKVPSQIAVEIKKVRGITSSFIRELLGKTQTLKEYDWYIGIEPSTKITTKAKNLMEISNIGVITIRRDQVKIAVRAGSAISARIYEMLEKNLPSEKYEIFIKDYQRAYQNIRTELNKVSRRIDDSLALLSEPPFKPRIPRELLDKIDELENVEYRDLLKDFKTDYEKVRTTNDENSLILSTLEKLWGGKYGKMQGAKAFNSFEKFEPILKRLPRYRDYMIHPFQVFLMGSLVLDANHALFSENHKKHFANAKNDSLEFAWLLCSTFHDICYPLQKYEEFSSKFFLEFLESKTSPIIFQTEKLLLDGDNLKYIDQLVSLYEHYQNQEKTWEYDSSCKIDNKLRSLMISEANNKNHALLSSISLIKKILAEDFVATSYDSYIKGRFSTDVYPAAIAIALHDKEMFNKLNKPIICEEMPLCFLLIYCDLVQECGRVEVDDSVMLSSFELKEGAVESTLVFMNDEDLVHKWEETEEVYSKIACETMHFKLNVRCGGTGHTKDTLNA